MGPPGVRAVPVRLGRGQMHPKSREGLLTRLLVIMGLVAQRVPAWGQRVPAPGVTQTRGACGVTGMGQGDE